MAGGAGDRDDAAHGAGNRAHDADRQSLIEQDRALLDVHFEIADELRGRSRELENFPRIEIRFPQRRRQGLAIGIAPLEQLRIEPSR